jgi:hypothetical protein
VNAKRIFSLASKTLIYSLMVGFSGSLVAFGGAAAAATWAKGNSGNWSNGLAWSPEGVPNSPTTDVSIDDGISTVTLDVSPSVASLQIGGGNALTMNPGTLLRIFGPSFSNSGAFDINGGRGFNTIVDLNGDIALSGGGTVKMLVKSGGGVADVRGAGVTLTNADNTIQGAGTIGFFGALKVVNHAAIEANASGQTLDLNAGGGGVTNTGLLEATSGGTLALHNSIANGGGRITAKSGTVDVFGTIAGGALNISGGGVMQSVGLLADLNGVTISSGSVYTTGTGTPNLDVTTRLDGAIVNKGTLHLKGGGGSDAKIYLGSDVTLSGGGTISMSVAGGLGSAFLNSSGNGLTLTNTNNTIQGAGFLGSDAALNIVNEATIDANASGQTLDANSFGSIGGVTNTGLLEATSGGTLALHKAIANAGGTIAAKGGTVNVFGAIAGGTLSTSGGGVMQSVGGAADLRGVTISPGSAYAAGLSTTTQLDGAIVNKGKLQISGGGGFNAVVNLGSAVTLSGGGTVALSSGTTGGAFLGGSGVTLTNADNTIQGAGLIGDTAALGFVNGLSGRLLANVGGGTLNVNGAGGSFLNNGTVKVADRATLIVTGDSNGFLQNRAVSGALPITQVDGTLIAPHGLNINAGMLEGTGTVEGNVAVQGSGVVHPGHSPGILTIQGTYTQGAGGQFDVSLAGLTAGAQYSQLDVIGSASLDGALDVSKSASFALAAGDTFTIMKFANSRGDFSSFDYSGAACSVVSMDLWNCANGVEFAEQFASGNTILDLMVKRAAVSLAATPVVPELSTWAMMLLGFVSLGYAGFRQARRVPGALVVRVIQSGGTAFSV